MATRTIPAKTIFTCDGCKTDDARRVMGGKLKVERGGTDYQGCVVGDASSSWELCDRCIMKFETWCTAEIKKMRNEL